MIQTVQQYMLRLVLDFSVFEMTTGITCRQEMEVLYLLSQASAQFQHQLLWTIAQTMAVLF